MVSLAGCQYLRRAPSERRETETEERDELKIVQCEQSGSQEVATRLKNQVTDISISIPGSHIDGLAKAQVKRLHNKKNAPVYENNNIHVLSSLGTCRKALGVFKLKLEAILRICFANGATGEIARKATKAKLYNDRLKCVLATKCHLNASLKSLSYISEEDITSVRIPIVQVMGLEAKVSSLRLIEKKKYVVEDLKSFRFPQTSEQLKSGELESLINSLTLIEETKKEKKFTMDEWLTEVTWDAKDEESDDEESQEDSDDQEIYEEITNIDSGKD
ncbi:hypothetical protein [Parasitella parasitica]|uniref:Uncharacterized protein n=1 Tax=Parasitella parasitica TaxID=35722 RepID=A0A0B7NWY8_9FUNG|nr:hypothetical protein [Parasitella parasitica]